MAQISDANSNHGVVLDIKDSDLNNHNPTPSSVPKTNEDLGTSPVPVLLIQKVIAELVGTYFLIFAGCATIEVDLDEENAITLLGKAIAWGLAVMVLVYSVGHISGPHFNPAITIAFASCQKFPWKQVPIYISAQVIGSTLASGTLRLIFNGKNDHFVGSAPKGSDVQSLVMEFIITLFLMFVVSGVAADNRAVKDLAGLVIGATISLNILVGGYAYSYIAYGKSTVNFRGIDESSKELGASNRVEALQGSVDIHRGTDFRCRRGCLALQHLQANRQRVDTLVFGRPDDGLEIHLVDGQFVFNNGDLVFDDHEDEAPADVVDGQFNNLDLVFDNDEDDAPAAAAAAEVDTGTGGEHQTEFLFLAKIFSFEHILMSIVNKAFMDDEDLVDMVNQDKDSRHLDKGKRKS
ncbi:hypothetical protein RHSIM_Rhsim13G0186900 [Rhododendron simsii]|uniref:Uncharacterized protein n=1 Tax=Rhododendron simsii TaxID=118357 RepID=A0A834L779_RHOSS|nr:hypothetical protein RHSIM_Rhsim13G0186900 [Rhododendron simsii]